MDQPLVVVADNVRGAAVDRLGAFCRVVHCPDVKSDPVRFWTLLREADALIVRNQTVVTRELLLRAPRLQVIGRAGAGLDNIDLDAAEDCGVVVTFAPGSNAISVAELAIGMMIALARSLVPADQSARLGLWERERFIGNELYGKSLGLIGFGQVGYRVAMRARAFGMRVRVYDPYLESPDVPSRRQALEEAGAECVSLDTLYASSEIISVHAPLTSETAKMIDQEAFSKMRDRVLFINTSRGPIVDELALIKALQSGKVAGAALDVREVEPPVAGVLETLPNVILTPHIGGFTREGLERVVSEVISDVERVLRGQEALHAVKRRRPLRAAGQESRA